MIRYKALGILLAGAVVTSCVAEGEEDAAASAGGSGAASADRMALGPADGHDLSPTDLDRVQVGDQAPDFTLTALDGPPVTLSGFRGSSDVVLVFYRGHW